MFDEHYRILLHLAKLHACSKGDLYPLHDYDFVQTGEKTE